MTTTVAMVAPTGVQTISTRSGNTYNPDSNGQIAVKFIDVADLLAAGCTLQGAQAGNQFGNGAGTFFPQGQISAQVSAAGIGNGADTTEDTLFTFSLPANSFDKVGRGVSIFAAGSLANNAHTKTVKVYFGTGIVFTVIAATTGNVAWQAILNVFRSSIAKTQVGQGCAAVGATHSGVSAILPGAEDDTAAITIKVTGQTATANASDVVGNMMIIDAMN